MRVVGGSARGRALQAPPGTATRPTSDRVREAVFSMLASLDAVEGATVLDLFAGSGALGIESVSRRAETAALVDSDPAAVAAARANADVLGDLAHRVTVVRGDALGYLHEAGRFDLVFADPPYAYDRWPELLDLLRTRAGLVVAETGESQLSPGPGWETVKVKKYGGTVVSIVQPAVSAALK